MQNEAGLNATSKLSNMISDQKASEGWNADFQLKGKFGFGLDVMMLTSGSWEINDPKCGKSLVPPQLLPAVTEFEARFLEKMPNRSVSWIFTHGRAIVQLVNRAGGKFILVLNSTPISTQTINSWCYSSSRLTSIVLPSTVICYHRSRSKMNPFSRVHS